MSGAAVSKAVPHYAELHCLSNFTFLTGASHPEELVRRAAELGYQALAITDECSVAGIVRAHVVARDRGIKLIIGSHFFLADGLQLVLLATSAHGYSQLCALITKARRAAEKGSYQLSRECIAAAMLDECIVIWPVAATNSIADGRWLQQQFPGRLWISRSIFLEAADALREARAAECAVSLGIPQVVTGHVHMHRRGRRALQDTLTAIRHCLTVAAAGEHLFANSERYLRGRPRIGSLYPAAWVQATCEIAARCHFNLEQLQYEYPREVVPRGFTATSYLRQITEAGIKQRWPEGELPKVRQQIEHELSLIAELRYETYFLTVYDIVKFARGRQILCQGRGSAANSAVCYCLGITEVDPARMSMLMERFISRERAEPPDIDVDFENARREEVIQYIYNKYGRDRAALTATVITYRPRGAIRDVGKALGLAPAQIDQIARAMQWWDGRRINVERLVELGFDPESPVIRRLLVLSESVLGFPRHLSQHVGGFLVSERPLSELVPVENAAMPERTVIQWDKDDLDALGLLKIDVLALGMLTALHKSFDLLTDYYGRVFSMATVPAEDPEVYQMVSRGETIGVFQIESRAQMAMLPRLRPACFYDLVIEVAIVRPGPIQGDMVHPYLRRRTGEEPVVYPGEAVKSVLERTLGVPIFQEQVMQLAIIAAGFTAGEADQLRRSMSAWRRHGTVGLFEQRLIQGMLDRGYCEQFARQVFKQIEGFGEYGFPESHAASFALLVYVSAWLKCHHPAAFFCALLNSQPMGFYAPAQLVQAARRQDVEILPLDVNVSAMECVLEQGKAPRLRLGFCLVHGLSSAVAERIERCRGIGLYRDMEDFTTRVLPDRKSLQLLAAADAFSTLAGNRHHAHWQASGIEGAMPLWQHRQQQEAMPLLRAPSEGDNVVADYQSIGLTLRRHPLALLRPELNRLKVTLISELADLPDATLVHSAGLVITRQRPGTANNVTFVTLEDDTGYLNLVVWEQLAEARRSVLLRSRLMGVTGRLQKQNGVLHLIATRLEDYSYLLGELTTGSRGFH